MGATAGRTTLTGEGLQHDDGHSHVLFSVVPNVRAYDPAYAYELAAIVRHGIERMYAGGAASSGNGSSPHDVGRLGLESPDRDVYYYVTLYNENYAMPARPADLTDEQIVRGLYRLLPAPELGKRARFDGPPVRLIGSGSILPQVVAARDLLAERGIAAEVYSATSFGELRRDGLAADRWNRLHPTEPARVPHVAQILPADGGPIVIATDWIRAYPDLVGPWLPKNRIVLGTDGFGRSDTREALRALFEIDPAHVAAAAAVGLARDGRMPAADATVFAAELGVDPEAADPLAL